MKYKFRKEIWFDQAKFPKGMMSELKDRAKENLCDLQVNYTDMVPELLSAPVASVKLTIQSKEEEELIQTSQELTGLLSIHHNCKVSFESEVNYVYRK